MHYIAASRSAARSARRTRRRGAGARQVRFGAALRRVRGQVVTRLPGVVGGPFAGDRQGGQRSLDPGHALGRCGAQGSPPRSAAPRQQQRWRLLRRSCHRLALQGSSSQRVAPAPQAPPRGRGAWACAHGESEFMSLRARRRVGAGAREAPPGSTDRLPFHGLLTCHGTRESRGYSMYQLVSAKRSQRR